MSTLADQIRELQLKLEKINEAPGDAANSYAGAQAATVASGQPDDAAGVDAAVAQQAAPASNEIPTIDAPTFSQAYAQARKQGLKKFKWCGVYAVKDKPKPPNPQPVVKPAPSGTAINDQNPDGSYVGQIGLPSQTPSYQPGA